MQFNKTVGPESREEDLARGNQFRESPLSSEIKQKIRRLRRKDKSASEIAAIIGCKERFVVEAIGSMRGKRINSNHRTLSVNAYAGDWMLAYQERTRLTPKEPMWVTFNRLIEEFEKNKNDLDFFRRRSGL